MKWLDGAISKGRAFNLLYTRDIFTFTYYM